MSYIDLRGPWCGIIVLNGHGPRDERSDTSKGRFYEELDKVFDHFPKYHMKILLGDFNAKLGREDIFKPTVGNERLHQDRNVNGVRIVNSATSKNVVRVRCSPTETFVNAPGPPLMGKLTSR